MTDAIASLTRRLDRMESCEAIRALVSRYALGADRRNDPAVMGPLFSEDAVWEAEGFARYESRTTIAQGLSDIAEKRVLWSLHYMVSPLIELDETGDVARCRWGLWELATMRDEGEGAAPSDRWLGGVYDAVLTRTAADGWRFTHVVLDIRFEGLAGSSWVLKKGFHP
ncbi:MAG: nuclear transport factor 2 family protein [Caulobacteraceae bacterium]|nr:nuclear transport factor 2 family protein [Caulobacteraceae bacterium]